MLVACFGSRCARCGAELQTLVQRTDTAVDLQPSPAAKPKIDGALKGDGGEADLEAGSSTSGEPAPR